MDNTIVAVIVCVLLPPLAVILKRGFDKHFFINIVLCILGYIPGLVHALWICFKK